MFNLGFPMKFSKFGKISKKFCESFKQSLQICESFEQISQKFQIKELSLSQKFWFQITISLQPDGVSLWYFKLSIFDLK